MKKISFILLAFLLVLQGFIGPLAASAAVNVDQGEEIETAETSGEETTEEISEDPTESVATEEDTAEETTEEPTEPEGTDQDITEETTETEDLPIEEATVPEESLTTEEEEAVTPVCEEQPEDLANCEELIETLEPAPSEIQENILTGVTLFYEDHDGNPVESPSIDSIISVKYKWALRNNHGYTDGSTFTFNLPDELEVYNAIEASPMEDENGLIVGYFTVTMDGQATITFTDFIENHSNITGNLEVITELNKKIIVTEGKVITITPIIGGESITIPITYPPSSPSLTKKGLANQGYNADTITWTVDFNKTLETVENAVFSDPIQTGLALEEGTIELYHLNVRLNGEVIEGDPVDSSAYTVGKTTDGKDFIIDFEGDIDSAYRVVFKTTITDENQSLFENTAMLLSNGSVVGEATASVTVKRGTPLEKKATHYDAVNQTITWEIKYNYDEKNIAQKNALLKDYFNGTQELIGPIKVQKITIDQDGKEIKSEDITSGYTVTPKTENNSNGFELQFHHDINSAYKITYKTKAINRVIDRNEIVNTVTTGDKQATGKQWVDQQILFKSNQNVNYKDKTIDWTITFNRDRYEMKNVILKDIFTNKGLTLDPDSVIITTDNRTLEKGIDYTFTNDAENDQFIIEFNGILDTPHTVKYKTTFDYEKRENKNLTYLQNKVILQWGEQDNRQSKETTSNFHPDQYTKSNGFKNGTYNAVNQEITWNVGINYNLKTLSHAIVEDFILGNQKVLKDTIKVYRMSLTGGSNGTKTEELISEEDYSVSWITDSNNNSGFRLEFKNEINSPYLITYKTSLDGLDFVERQYLNTATLYDDLEKQTNLSATVTIPYGGEYTSKSGSQNGKIINWSVKINYAQTQVSNAKVTDMPNDDQTILRDSIRLFATNIDGQGNIIKGAQLTEGVEYELVYIESHDPYAFQLSFKNQISEPYILEYQAFILKAPASITNSISFTGEHVKEEKIKSSTTIEVKKTSGMGDGTGVLGGLRITKIDASTGALLEGAQFTLKDKNSGSIIKTGTTDNNGVLQFDRLLFGDYLLEETQAPKGYRKNEAEISITIDKAYVIGDLEKVGNEVQLENEKGKGKIIIKKVDTSDHSTLLADVEFELSDRDGKIWTGTTNTNGLVEFNDLPYDTYKLKETMAHKDYALDSTVREVVLYSDSDGAIKEITIENHKKVHAFKLKKVSSSNPNLLLKDAEFKLMYKKQVTDEYAVVAGKEKLKTDENGEIYEANLDEGFYQLIETKAPSGYRLDSTPIEFVIEKDQTRVLELVKTNSRKSGGSSGNPNKPDDEGDPKDPENPSDPGDEDTPNNPENPSDPGDEEVPNHPENPSDPGDEEVPNNPENPSDPGNEDDHVQPDIPEKPGNQEGSGNPNVSNVNGKNVLPQTGEAYPVGIVLAGIVSILIGFWILMSRRRI